MKFICKKILQYYLKYITKLVLAIHRPTIIAIAGSTNKTFVKEEITWMLKRQGIDVRSNPKSFNTEIGLPLAVLYLSSGYNSYKNWLPIIFKAFLSIFQQNYPNYLVLELGISDPGDMKYLLSIIKPKIAIITDITQRYLESFSDVDKLVEEYEYLVKKIKKTGLIILNYDNIRVRNLSKIAQAKVCYFSLQNSNQSLINQSNFCHAAEIKVDNRGQNINVKLDSKINRYHINRYGKHHIYALLIRLIVKNYAAKQKM